MDRGRGAKDALLRPGEPRLKLDACATRVCDSWCAVLCVPRCVCAHHLMGFGEERGNASSQELEMPICG